MIRRSLRRIATNNARRRMLRESRRHRMVTETRRRPITARDAYIKQIILERTGIEDEFGYGDDPEYKKKPKSRYHRQLIVALKQMLRAGHNRALDVVYDIDNDSVVYQGSIDEEANVVTLVSPEEVFEDINYRQTGDDTFAKIFAAKIINEIEDTIQEAKDDFEYDEADDDDFDDPY